MSSEWAVMSSKWAVMSRNEEGWEVLVFWVKIYGWYSGSVMSPNSHYKDRALPCYNTCARLITPRGSDRGPPIPGLARSGLSRTVPSRIWDFIRIRCRPPQYIQVFLLYHIYSQNCIFSYITNSLYIYIIHSFVNVYTPAILCIH